MPGFVKKKKKRVYGAHERVAYEAALETAAAWNFQSSVAPRVNVHKYHSTFGSGIFEFHGSPR